MNRTPKEFKIDLTDDEKSKLAHFFDQQKSTGEALKMPWDKGTTVIDAMHYGHRDDEIQVKHTDGIGNDYSLVKLADIESEIPELVTRVRAMIEKMDIN